MFFPDTIFGPFGLPFVLESMAASAALSLGWAFMGTAPRDRRFLKSLLFVAPEMPCACLFVGHALPATLAQASASSHEIKLLIFMFFVFSVVVNIPSMVVGFFTSLWANDFLERRDFRLCSYTLCISIAVLLAPALTEPAVLYLIDPLVDFE